MKVKDPTSETAIKLIQSATELFNDFGYTGTSINPRFYVQSTHITL